MIRRLRIWRFRRAFRRGRPTHQRMCTVVVSDKPDPDFDWERCGRGYHVMVIGFPMCKYHAGVFIDTD